MRIWDAFQFNGEFEALHARLALPGVYRHVLVEAILTHSGQRKDRLYYDWTLPNVICVNPDLSGYDTSWERENAQRNAVMEGLTCAQADDVVMLSDCDECVFQDGLARAISALAVHPAVVLCQTMYNYNRQWEDRRGWRGTVITTYAHLKQQTPQTLRDMRERLPRIPQAGEHLSWFGGPHEIARKLSSFAHVEYSGMDDETIRQRVADGRDLFDRWSLEKVSASSYEPQPKARELTQDIPQGEAPVGVGAREGVGGAAGRCHGSGPSV